MGASRVACASFNIGTNTTITITRDKSTYTHTITFKFGSYTDTIATKTSQTSVVWAPNTANLYAQIPNSVSGYGTITCQTYDGNTLIGTTTAGFYAYAVKANCIPVVTAVIEDTNAATIAVTGDKSALVGYISKPKVTLTETAKNGASIKSRQIYNPVGLTATSSPYTFDTVYSNEFNVKVTDSRGYVGENTYIINKFIDYIPAYISSVSIQRLETTSETARATIEGYCSNVSFGAVENAFTLKYRYKTSGEYGSYIVISNPTWNTDGSFTATVDISGLSLDAQYTFEFTVEDKLTSFSPDAVILTQSSGDVRIGKDYFRIKNRTEIGSLYEDSFKPIRSMRSVNGVPHYADIGMSNNNGIASMVLQLYKRQNGVDTRLARYDMRQDGFLYHHDTSLSVAEMMAMATDMSADGGMGYLLLNAGSSMPILAQWGRVHKVPAGANVITSQSIEFLYSFNSVPAMYTVGIHNLTTTLEAFNATPTKTGCTLYFRRGNTTNTGLFWLAIGDGRAAMPE